MAGSHTPTSMIIEFIGPPGAGKTTLIPAAADALERRGQKPYTAIEAARPFTRRTLLGMVTGRLAPKSLRRPLLWRLYRLMSALGAVRYFAGHLPQLRLVLASQWRRPAAAGSRERRVLYWYYRQAGDHGFLGDRLQSGESLLFDEGFIHRVVQLFASAVEQPQADTISNYVATLPRPDVTIAIMAPVETCQQRIYERGLWDRFGDKTDEEVGNFVASAHAAVGLALDAASDAGWPIVFIDNSADDPAPAAAQLGEVLSGLPLRPELSPTMSASVA